MWRKIELAILSYIYRNRTVRNAKRWAEQWKKLVYALITTSVVVNWNYKTDRLIKAEE
jgi:N-dimethylarginine dimethylaminohydrolase